MDSINSRIAEELGVRPQQVEAAVALLDEGSTTPNCGTWKSACATCENSTNGV